MLMKNRSNTLILETVKSEVKINEFKIADKFFELFRNLSTYLLLYNDFIKTLICLFIKNGKARKAEKTRWTTRDARKKDKGISL